MRTQGERKIVSGLVCGCLAPERLILKEGARVMFVKNNFEAGFVNGTTGTVIGFDDDSRMPVVRTGRGREILAAPETWRVEEGDEVIAAIRQVPLRLAWAVTVHKSQGMTLDAAAIDLARSFEYGMGYVALSRVRAFSGLRLLGLNDIALRVSPEIAAFDCRLKKKSEDFERELADVEEVVDKPKREVKDEKPKKTRTYSVEEIRKKFPRAYEPWTEEDDRALIKYKQGGKTVKELAAKFGRKEGAIRSRLKKLME
jgi:ATP-dependent DNA helicase PIF1